MNPTSAYIWTALRSALIVGGVLLLAYPISRMLARPGNRWSTRFLWAGLLAPWLTPALVVGYAYSTVSLTLVRNPLLNDVVYGCLITARLVAVAVVILRFAPAPPLSRQALWCAALARPRGRPGRPLGRWRVWLRGPAANGMVAAVVIFVLAFAEFEIAALMDVNAWSVWLFDAQSGGMALSQSLKYALLPLFLQLLLLLPVALDIYGRRDVAVSDDRQLHTKVPTKVALGAYLLVAIGAVCAMPVIVVLRQTIAGFSVVLGDFHFMKQVAASSLLAGAAAFVAFVGSGHLADLARRSTRTGMFLLLICVPGLLGSLLLALVIRATFQWSFLDPLRAGPLPLLLALILLVLPMAVLLRALMRRLGDAAALHVAQLLRASSSADIGRAGRRLRWDLKDRANLYVFTLVFVWAYFDLCIPVLLRPQQMTLAPDLLYNQMHYGQRAVLSAMLCLFAAVPVCLLMTVGTVSWAYHRRPWHG